MSYVFLGQNLHGTADAAKRYFASEYGAVNFVCEAVLEDDLPLKPTWQATLPSGYTLCVEVRESPFSNTLYEFVMKCATRGMPVRLWVAMPHGTAAPTFNAELRQAHNAGVGVVQIAEDGAAHVFHRPVPLSLFALKKTDLARVPKTQREHVKTSESTFLDGTPDQGCQGICQALEHLTRDFSEFSFNEGWWRQPKGAKSMSSAFFQTKPWANVLEQLEDRLEISKVRGKAPTFSRQLIVRARGHTDWRNDVSHKPKTLRQLKDRDAKLRTMFEATRDLLVDWYAVARTLRLVR